MKILITGGAGFIGSALIRHIIKNTNDTVINLDKLTYAGNLESLSEIDKNSRYHFEQVDICNKNNVEQVLAAHQPNVIMHLAAESHVDRSIDGPSEFIQTNIVGTSTLLECARHYYNDLSNDEKENFLFHHISTDEVYGDLDDSGDFFTESTSYDPSSPYSASKAASDHLVRAWGRTYKLPTVITNCSNNYGPYHFPEKLIPLVILNALEGKALPIYGDGQQIRDWLYVEDHARALYKVATEGKTAETYNIGGHNEVSNLNVVKTICGILEDLVPNKPNNIDKYTDLIEFVTDRPGHDIRYAIDASKIKDELNWAPEESFTTGIRKTVQWYLENKKWWSRVLDGSYTRERIGKLT